MEEFTKRFIIEFYPYIIVIFILGILSYIFYSKIIGKAGEHHVKGRIKKLPKDKYLIINDLMVMVDGKTYQIDHVIVSTYWNICNRN